MFAPKGLFSDILCPYISQCNLPNCLFSHAQPLHEDAIASTQTSIVSVPSEKEDSDIARRKRRKVEDGSGSPSVSVSAKPKATLLSIKREISPPPLRRTENHSQTASHRDTVTPASEIKAKLTPSNKITKVETLNPRLVKSAPATHDMRFKLVSALYQQLVRLNSELSKAADDPQQPLVSSDQDLIKMALDLEERAAIDKPAIYSNIIKNKIMAYKRMNVSAWKEERTKTRTAHQAATGQKEDPRSQQPIMKPPDPAKPIITGLTDSEEISFLSRLYTPLNGLSKHGYVTQPISSSAIAQAKQGIEAAKGWEVCDRCKTRFQVFPGRREADGSLTSGGTCTHHWSKPYFPEKDPMNKHSKRERRYRCCGEAVGDSPGCTQGNCHVFKISEEKRLAAILNFEETPVNDKLATSNTPVCIDGEMGYTVYGLELIRLTATSFPHGEELFDVLVRPLGEVLDLNSRWSGVWPNQFTEALPWDDAATNDLTADKNLRIIQSPGHARSLLFRYISRHTPLIGHGLENDLNATRLIHPVIIDTVFLYPHQAGLPFRNALKALMMKHLGRLIQATHSTTANGQVTENSKALADATNGEKNGAKGGRDSGLTKGEDQQGHDSKEDARSAGELVRYKIKTEWAKMREQGWTLQDGNFIAPSTQKVPFQGLTAEGLEGDYIEMAEQSKSSKTKRKANEVEESEANDG